MARKGREVTDRAYYNNLFDLISLQKDLNNDIRTDIFGVSNHNVDISDTQEKISSLVNGIKNNIGGDFFDCINELNSEFNMNQRATISKFKEKLTGDQNIGLFQSYLRANDSKINKYEDLKLITAVMPQLRQAKTAIINSILSPDDFTKQIALNFDVNGKSLAYEDPLKYSSIQKILKKHKFTKLMKSVVDNTITLGTYYVAVIPYNKLYKDLLKQKEKYIVKSSDNTYKQTNIKEMKNRLNSNKILKESVMSVEELAEEINSVYMNSEISSDSSNLLSEDVMIAELKKAKITSSEENINSTEFIDNIEKKLNKKSTNTEFNDGFISDDKNDLKISGCKIKKLDPRRILELSIDEDNCLGYLYIENAESAKAIRDFRKFNFSPDLNNTRRENAIDTIYKEIGNMLIQKLDKKFIEKYANIKERLYDILKYADVNRDSKIKVSYLSTDEVVKFEINDGESVFEPALFFSRLYMMVLLSTITAKVVRSSDIRAYYVDVDADGGMNNMLYNAIDTLQSTNHSILSANHISKIISTFTAFDDLIIPRANGEKNTIDFDIISGQQVDLSTDLLELLEQICVNSTGVPLQLLQSSNDVDFARTYTMLNISFMKSILDKQMDINPSITELISKILKCEMIDDGNIENLLNNLECYLQSPMNLLLTNILDQINNAKDVAQGLAEVVVGTGDDASNTELMDKFILAIVKKYAPNIPFKEFEEIRDLIKQKLNEKKIDNPEETEE